MNTVTVRLRFGDELKVSIPRKGEYRQIVRSALDAVRDVSHWEMPVTGELTQSPLGRYELTLDSGTESRTFEWKEGAFK